MHSGVDRQTRGPVVSPIPKSTNALLTVNIEIKDVTETRKNLVVALDPTEVAAEHKATLAEFSRMARLPGFRPGKAPAALVQKHYGREIGEEFKQKVVSKAYRAGLEQSKLDVITLTQVDPGTIDATAAATVTFTLDIRPIFSLPDYSNLETKVQPVEPTEAEVEQVIEQLRSERADFKVVERPAQKGDYVKLSYEGTVDGKPAAEVVGDKQIYAKVPQTWEEVEGENEGLIPGLGKQLNGVSVKEKKDVAISFPAEFTAVPALAGKTVNYTVEIFEIRERILAPLDEAFFKAQQVDNLEGLKAKLTNNLKSRKDYENRRAQRQQVTEALNAKVDFPIPESMIESETQQVLRNFIEQNMRQGVPAEQFEKDKKELYEGARKAAAVRVKSQLILAKIAEQEKISVSEQDIDNVIYREAVQTGTRPDKIVKELTNDRERLRALQQSIIFDKALDLLVSKATVSTVSAQS